MTCERIRQLLSDYLDGELSSAVTTRVQGHLYGCPGCEREHQALRLTVQLLAAQGRQRIPIDCRDAVLARIREGDGARAMAPASRPWWQAFLSDLALPQPGFGLARASAVAGLALVCVGGAWFLRAETVMAPGGPRLAATGRPMAASVQSVAQRPTSEEELTRFHAPASISQAMGRDNGIILVSDWVQAP
jgi:anti-sigma factor RsiW